MVTRGPIRRPALVAALLVAGGWTAQPAALAAAASHDFRDGRFDNDALALFGKNSEQLVKATARGLLVRIPPKMGPGGAVGIALRPRVRGDFEITATYRLLEFATPASGAGIRVKLTAELDGPPKERISVERAAIPKDGNVCTSTLTEDRAGGRRRSSFVRRPVQARSGRLRMARRGAVLKVDYTDDGGRFRSLRETTLGTDDPSRVTLVLDTGRSPQGAAVLLEGLEITAQGLELPGEEPPSTWPAGPGAAAALALLALAGSAAIVLARRARARARARRPVSTTATARSR